MDAMMAARFVYYILSFYTRCYYYYYLLSAFKTDGYSWTWRITRIITVLYIGLKLYSCVMKKHVGTYAIYIRTYREVYGELNGK